MNGYKWVNLGNDYYCNFLKKLLFLGKIGSDEFHMEMGRHEGYPMCCIDNFIRLARSGHLVSLYMDNKYGYDDCEYVRCLKCRKEKPYANRKMWTSNNGREIKGEVRGHHEKQTI